LFSEIACLGARESAECDASWLLSEPVSSRKKEANMVIGKYGIGFGLASTLAAAASATEVNLITTTNGSINGALFERTDFRPAGSGVIHSFVRISSNNPQEQGYNTSGRPLAFDENNSPTFTRDLQLSDLPVRSIAGQGDFYEFLLDINQQSANPYLSLDQVKIFTGPTLGIHSANLSDLGTLRYDMDALGDSWVDMNYNLNSGSGQGDVRMLVPVSDFAGVSPTAAVYLFSRFGDQPNENNNDGYEEWSIQGGGGTSIPLPLAAGMGLAGLVGVGIARRRSF
jgi:hypothetical protein